MDRFMGKCKKWEFISMTAFAVLGVIYFCHSWENHFFGGDCFLDVILVIALLLALMVFALAFALKIFLHRERWRRWLQGLGPVAIIGFTVLYVNGMNDSRIALINIIGCILMAVVFLVYNAYYLTYFGKGHTCWIVWVLYIVTAVAAAIMNNSLFYLHNYLLGFLVPAVWLGYVEDYIKMRIKAKKAADAQDDDNH